MRPFRPVLISIIFAFSISQNAFCDVGFKQDKRSEVIELSGLASDPSCAKTTFAGKVVKRDFGADAMTLNEFVVEYSSGTREDINVEMPTGLDNATQHIVYYGLQRLTQVGRTVHGRAIVCGSGGFLTVEEIH
jgi:hypothetical protein